MSYYYRNGEIGIIILCVHDGKDRLDLIKRKKNYSDKDNKEKFVLQNDVNTRIISNKIRKNLSLCLNQKPYLLINNINRKYLDLNRELKLGTSNQKSELYWYNFHNKLESLIQECKNKYGYCLLLDVHGNKHTHNIIQLGYGIKYKKLENLKSDNLSLQHLKTKYTPLSITIGERSLGKFIDNFLITAPSPRLNSKIKMEIIEDDEKYYKGGFITKYYSKKFLIDCIQIEISQDLRLNNILDFTSNAISSGICNFYKKNYL